MTSSIGKRLAEERRSLGHNQTAFADIGGVKRAAQVNYEGDRRSPDARYLSQIAEAGADVLYIVTGQRSTNVPHTGTTPPNSGERQWLIWYRQINPEDRLLIEPVIKGFAERAGKQNRRTG